MEIANENIQRRTIVIWFSCGAASAVAAKRTIEKYGYIADIKIVNNFVAEEDEDNRRFLKDVEQWLGYPIEIATNKNFPDCSTRTVWKKRNYMSGTAGAPCTTFLKKKARQQWENNNNFTDIVLGFTLDEKITKDDCFKIIHDAGIELPRIYKMGYSNANCVGCVKATSPTYWNHVRITHPEVFSDRAEQSRRIGAKLVRLKGQRIFLDELPDDAMGIPMKQMPSFDCGIFCEEKDFNDNDLNKISLDEAS
jgi:hypothetical protein